MTQKNTHTQKNQKNSPIVEAFLEEFDIGEEDQIIPTLIDLFMLSLEFITYHGLKNDFVHYHENPKAYKILLQNQLLKKENGPKREN